MGVRPSDQMNFREFMKNMGFAKKDYRKLVDRFIEIGKSDIDRLQSAVAAGNATEAADTAHSLKGAAITVGLTELYEIAKDIEAKSRNGQLEGVEAAARKLAERFYTICGVIQQTDYLDD